MIAEQQATDLDPGRAVEVVTRTQVDRRVARELLLHLSNLVLICLSTSLFWAKNRCHSELALPLSPVLTLLPGKTDNLAGP